MKKLTRPFGGHITKRPGKFDNQVFFNAEKRPETADFNKTAGKCLHTKKTTHDFIEKVIATCLYHDL